MKKLIIFLSIVVILTIIIFIVNLFYKPGINNKDLADMVIELYNSVEYNDEKLSKSQKEAVDEYITTITHVNHKVNISDYVLKDTKYRTDEKNSEDIFLENNECYIYYEDLQFRNYGDYTADIVVCNGYEVIVYYSFFNPPYESNKYNRKNNYVYVKSIIEDDIEKYIYVSTYIQGYKIVSIYNDDNKIDIDVKDIIKPGDYDLPI